ncbi:MAG TPA: DUF4190 domain-containing protein [Candidatus Aquilonibacter sp.]|nr:DUF4190 domain-containing protein [Candidatus Aquilonibacter sp.]
MSAIYKIIGEDGREYGPATAEQIRQWIAEGRVERRTPVFVDSAKDWNFVGLLPEFANCFATSSAPAPIAPPKPAAPTTGQIPKANSFATAGLVFGILSVTFACCCGGFPFNILGLIFSVVALVQIGENPQCHAGRGLAIGGLILSIASFFILLAVLAFGHTNFYLNTGQ